MKVLVTGGAGFMGARICRMLLERGDRVVALQRGGSPELAGAGVEIVRGDLRDAPRLDAALGGCEAVIHVAGKAGAWGACADYFGINVTGTENVIDGCRRAGVPRLVYTSSPSVVHAGGDIEGGDEALPYARRYASPYPATKALAEQAVLAADGKSLATVALRPHLIWGPGDPQLLPRLLERTASGPLRLPGASKLIDTVYVDNAARAHVLALDALDRNPACRGRAYFITNGEPWPQGRFIGALLQAAGRPVEIREIPPWLAKTSGAVCEWLWKAANRKSEPPVTRWTAEQLCTAHWYDISAARRDLAYAPEITIEAGLDRVRAWFETHRDGARGGPPLSQRTP